jgi:regulatory protein
MGTSIKSAALRLLKVRPRSTGELKERLKAKGFSEFDIQTTVEDLTASGLLNDRAFTKSWITYRLARPFGFKRISRELEVKGIGKEMIKEAIVQAMAGFDQLQAARQLAERRWGILDGVDPEKRKKRVLDFLIRRGFEPDAAFRALKNLK